eukprot:CAMPEP_0171644420 /NCGR_PEP_ID=MMETSP0990-20121206/33368_1 /TAXON_ID=483369 /ORGANISM="non described non described, Strain CCMP2098" /LENGTH=78 /DNA_ID=CAMNT_0012220485 /DNA_START=125 /DNA_END=361 /DNA_ORIENTATION=+
MKKELKSLFDAVVKKPDIGCTRKELLLVARRAGEDPEDLEDLIDLLEFDEDTDLLEWNDFYEWWSEEIDPKDYDPPST